MFDLFLFIMIINIINKLIFMTTVYIDSILYSPKDYNSMYNYNQYNPYENKQNNILDIIMFFLVTGTLFKYSIVLSLSSFSKILEPKIPL